MQLSEFARLYQVRGSQLMWFLGAGASANADVPTAGDMIADFKASIYASRQGVTLEQIGDLGDPRTREMLQRYFDTLGGFPPAGADDEYAAYFEEAYPKEADRQRYLAEWLRGAHPSFGHLVLAALLIEGRARHVWMTNMDRCVEDAVAQLGSTADLIVASLGEPELARNTLNDGRIPLAAKLHGDYQSRRLKNTAPELATQDADMRTSLVDACLHGGLVVIGYSGRDHSVMDALQDAASRERPFPAGLFWIHRGDHPLHPSVNKLIDTARAQGAEAEVIEAPTFDEVMGDVLALQKGMRPDLVAKVNARREVRLVDSPLPEARGGFPVVRTNALPVTSWPTVAVFVPTQRRPSWPELREVTAGSDILVAPSGNGVLAFGREAEITRALSSFGPRGVEARGIDPSTWSSNEQYLFNSAMTRAIVRGLPLLPLERRVHRLLIPQDSIRDPRFVQITKIVGPLRGTLQVSGLEWAEGVELQLVHRVSRLWLLVRPVTWVARGSEEAEDERRVFVNARYEKRWNLPANTLLEAWVTILVGTTGRDVCAFNLPEGGTDALFRIEATTAFSARATR